MNYLKQIKKENFTNVIKCVFSSLPPVYRSMYSEMDLILNTEYSYCFLYSISILLQIDMIKYIKLQFDWWDGMYITSLYIPQKQQDLLAIIAVSPVM